MDSAISLTPSEIELLVTSAEDQPILFGNLPRKIVDEETLLPLLEHAFVTALEANEAVGNFTCQVQDRRSLRGLRIRKHVEICVNGAQHRWPEPSLEASLTSLVRRLSAGKESLTIAELIEGWLGEGAINHLQAGLRWIYESLVVRGWVERKAERRLELFRLTRYVVSERISDLLTGDAHRRDGPGQNVAGAHREVVAELLERDLDRELRRLMSHP